MDQAIIERILARQGAAPTPDNVNRIIQMSASDPSILERYSLGTAPAQISPGPGRQDIRGGGGMDDNASLLNLNKSIDQSIAKTDMPPPPTNGAPPPPANGGPRRAPVQPTYPPPREASGSPLQSYPAAPPQAALPSDPITVGMTGQSVGTDRRDPSTGAAPPPDTGGLEWLLPAILPAISRMFGGGGAPNPNAPRQLPNPQLPPQQQLPAPPKLLTGPPDNSGAPPPTPPKQARAPGQPMAPGPGQTAEDVARMQAETDAANAADARRLQDQIKARSAQESTRKTLEAGKRVFTGGRK